MSYTILITDDEPISVESAAQMVKRNFHKEVAVETCLSGKQAIERAAQIFPDIVIMDIKMFGINGLEAIRGIKDMNIGTEFVILSAFDYFDYAREAISLGVSEYLIKPVDEGKLCSTLRKLISKRTELKKERKDQLNQQERLMMSVSILEASFCKALGLPGEHSGDLEKMYELIGCPGGAGGYVILLQPTGEHLVKERGDSLLEAVCYFLKRVSNCIVGQRKNQIIVYITCGGEGFQRKEAEQMLANLESLFQREGVSMAAGVGRYYGEIAEAPRSYMEARSALKTQIGVNAATMGTFAAAWYEDMAETEGRNAVSAEAPGGLEEYISFCLEQADPAAAIQEIDRYVVCFQKEGLGFPKIKKGMTDIIIRLDRRFSFPVEDVLWMLDEIIKAASFEELSECVHDAMTQSTQILIGRNRKKVNDIIERAELYIAKHYMEPITLEQVALSVNLSQHYFSRFFKQEKGINFTDYLTDMRMEQAKLLFAQGALSIKEVAYQTGFQDPNYFSKKFKLIIGTTPSRFKNTDSRCPSSKKPLEEMRPDC